MLRDKIAALISEHEGRCENPWNFQSAAQCADAILKLPEIAEALEMRSRFVDDPGWQKIVETWERKNATSVAPSATSPTQP